MASGIKDKVAIIGMGCSKFGERWDVGPEELMLESVGEALADAGIERDRIDAAWLGVFFDEQTPEAVIAAMEAIFASASSGRIAWTWGRKSVQA